MKSFIKHESTYMCDCGYEALLVRQYQFTTKKSVHPEPENQIEMAMFSQSCRCKSWREQLRWIWNIICNHEIWADQVILDKEQVERLGQTLISLAKEMKD